MFYFNIFFYSDNEDCKMKTKQISIPGFIITVLTLCVTGQQIQTNSSTETVEIGSQVQFYCHVTGLQSNQKVTWFFVDHNVTISIGNEIQSGVHDNKYSIFRRQDTNTDWNLLINNVETNDVGSYKCFVNGTNPLVKVIHHLKVIGAPVPEAPHFDVTDCCVKEGVEDCALPLCRTNTSLTDVLLTVNNGVCMENNLIKVLQCGQDGRNHLGCCIRRGMSDLCQALCDAYGEADGTDYSSCIGVQTISLVECLKEGQYALPSQPTAVSAINLGTGIMITWKPPDENVDVVTGYKPQYRKKGDAVFQSKSPVESNQYTSIVSGLDLDTVYEVRVIALASSGASQPSYIVDIITRGVQPQSTRNDTVAECCKRTNVSSDCLSYCTPGLDLDDNANVMLNCHAQVDKIFRCMAGYGNHTPCCQRVEVPEYCYPLCQGEVMMSWDIVPCIGYSPMISGCMIEGSAILPAPPKNTHIDDKSVTSNSAVVVWEKSENYKPGEYFMVSWKVHQTDLPNWSSARVVAGTSYQITNLKQATMYDVVVSTVNDYGSSLPELTLVLVTEGISSLLQTPFNETQCCIDRGVPSECINLCNHEFRLGPDIFGLGASCPDFLGTMLICATDGRNHTSCCDQLTMEGECIRLCSLTHESTVTTDFLSCYKYKDQLSTCFDEGKEILPRVPQNISIKAIDIYSITIDWSAPVGPNVTNFVVQQSTDLKYWTKALDTNHTFAKVESLKPDTDYYFRVLANNSEGQSLPSVVVGAYTLPTPVTNGTQERNWLMLWKSKADCCEKSSNNSVCQTGCTEGLDLDPLLCGQDMDKIVACAADGRDHTACCQKYPDFPDACLPYCQGQSGSRDLQSALCLHYMQIMFACFAVGNTLIPSAPQSMKATPVSMTSIQMKWIKPAEMCDTNPCSYYALLWIEKTQTLKYKRATNDTKYIFNDLEPDTKYRVSVIATNSYGSSLPAQYVILMTLPDTSGKVTIAHYPSGVIDKGDFVQLGCAAIGNAIESVTWLRNKNVVSKVNLLNITDVSSDDSGLYTCSITFVDKTIKTKDTYLNVRFVPHPIKMDDDSVLPGVRTSADMSCIFTGYPNIITWTKDGHALQGGSKYIVPSLVTDDQEGTTTSTLRVMNVVSMDFGSYTCNATNKFGSNSITGYLRNTFPGTDLPPANPPTQGSVEECCRTKGVPSSCVQKICTYAIDINSIIMDPNLTHCLAYIEDFFFCGSDGKNHSKCCTEGGVVEFCLPLCSGQIPTVGNPTALLLCLSHAETMLNCAINAIQYVPEAPDNVRVSLFYDTVKVMWDFGVNADKVDVYHVWYKSGSRKKAFDGVVKNARSYTLPSSFIQKGQTITVWIVAQNDYGSSQPSNNASIKITGLVPIMPNNIHGKLMDATTINVMWEPPKTSLRIVKYTVYYKQTGDKESSISSVSTQTRLTGLKQQTTYFIRVAAVSADGVGQKSNYIRMLTGSKDESSVTTDSQQTQSKETVGIVVGLVLGILFLSAIVIVAVLVFRRMRTPRPAQSGHGAVSFENPQYSTGGQRVRGLPGETNEGNQFGYGKLNEERDNQHDYLTLEPQTTENLPATLNIDQA
ncbi:Neural cell adhesion molecule L1 [Mactra antiquata]